MIDIDLSQPIEVPTAEAMQRLGRSLAGMLSPGEVVFLSGPLGAGKTTLAQAIVRSLGYTGRVKSPSYGLIELYPMNDFTVAHLDLYRLTSSEEVADLGLEAYSTNDTLILIEWPSRGEGHLPRPDWLIEIEDGPMAATTLDGADAQRQVRVERCLG